MPLPADQKLIALGEDLLKQFDATYGLHPGFRPAHAKGIMLTGSFTPSPDAVSMTRAPHITRASTPVTVRFSSSTGLPVIPDNDPKANPRGLAIRFHLAERVHTDIISHSTDGFPTRTGQEFLEFLRAATSSDSSKPSPLEKFFSSHPRTLAFVQTPQACPVELRQRDLLRGDRDALYQPRRCWPLRALPDHAGRGDRASGCGYGQEQGRKLPL